MLKALKEFLHEVQRLCVFCANATTIASSITSAAAKLT